MRSTPRYPGHSLSSAALSTLILHAITRDLGAWDCTLSTPGLRLHIGYEEKQQQPRTCTFHSTVGFSWLFFLNRAWPWLTQPDMKWLNAVKQGELPAGWKLKINCRFLLFVTCCMTCRPSRTQPRLPMGQTVFAVGLVQFSSDAWLYFEAIKCIKDEKSFK